MRGSTWEEIRLVGQDYSKATQHFGFLFGIDDGKKRAILLFSFFQP